MVTSIQSNTSALQAFSKQMAVSANNVANVFTNDFKKSRAVNSEGKNGQVETTITKTDPPDLFAAAPLNQTKKLNEPSNTDLAEELTYQMIAGQGFSANTKVIKTYEETIGSLIDMIG